MFFSLLIITLSFLPVFTLEAQEGRLFTPLAYTKTYAMAAAAGLSVTLVPVLMGYFIRGKVVPEHRNPVDRMLIAAYRPLIHAVIRRPGATLLVAAAILVVGALALLGLRLMAGRGLPHLASRFWAGAVLLLAASAALPPLPRISRPMTTARGSSPVTTPPNPSTGAYVPGSRVPQAVSDSTAATITHLTAPALKSARMR